MKRLAWAARAVVEQSKHGDGAPLPVLQAFAPEYTQIAMDPVDACLVWYVGDYLKASAPGCSTRIGAMRVPGCADRA